MSNTPPPTSRRAFQVLIEIPAVIVTFLMMLHITANAVMRTWWNAPIDKTLEFVEYWYLPLLVFLGFIAAQHRAEHIAADLIFERLPTATRRFVLAAVLLACSFVCLGFTWYGWTEALHAYELKRTAGVSDLPAWQTYFLVPIAFGSLTVQFLLGSARAVLRPDADHIVSDPDEIAVREQFMQKEVER